MDGKMSTITMVMGKNVDDMTRDELIAAVKMLGSLVNTMNDARRFSEELRELRPNRMQDRVWDRLASAGNW
jgi:hypothetical protein